MNLVRPGRIAATFALASAAWILFSDQLADALFAASPSLLLWVSTLKGWFYVAVVTGLLWFTLRRIRRQFHTQAGALAESEERFRLLVEYAGDAIYLCLPDGAIVDVNPEASRQTGYSRRELIGMHARDLEVAGERSGLAAFATPGPSGRRITIETRHRRKNGEVFPVELMLVFLDTTGHDFVIGVARDISERKRVEEQARAAREFLDSIINAIPDPVFVKDRSGRYCLANDALCAMSGKPREALLGKRDGEVFLPDQAALFEAGDAMVLETGGVHVFEEAMTHVHGETFHLVTKKSLLVDAKGQRHVVGVIRDITERKRFQDAILREKAFTDAVIDSVPGLLYLYDDNGLLVRWNRRHQSLTGYDDGELARMHFLDWFRDSEEDLASVADAVARLQSSGYATVEAGLRTKFGERPQYYFTGVPLVIDGKSYFTGVGLDITARKIAEEELVRSRNRINNILDSMPSAVVACDDRGLVTHWNAAAATLSGTPRSAAIGQPLARVFPPVVPHREAMDTALREQRLTLVERVSLPMDNGSHLVDIQFFPLQADGVSGVVLRLDDVTERERLREMMVQTEKMISVGGIAAGIAHEINNPLGIVLQAAQNLAQRTRSDFPKNIEAAAACGVSMAGIEAYMKARKLDVFLADIRDAALRASATIRHMLDFSRKSESRRKVCDVTAIIDKALELASSDYDLKKSYDFKKIRIVRDYEDDLPALNCTEIELEQVFLNLLRNAAQAMAAAEPPTVDPRIVIRIGRQTDRLVVEVADNGPGMPPEVLRRAFEPFFTTKPVGVGTGLGLSVSFFIVTRGHGGTMTAGCGPEGGMTFRIELPLDGVSEAA